MRRDDKLRAEHNRIASLLEVHTWLWHIADWVRAGAKGPPPTSASEKVER